MKALVYLLFTQIKNRILNLRKKPALLILYGFVFCIIIVSAIFLLLATKNTSKTYGDTRIVYLIISGIGMLFLYSSVYTGLSTGSTFFTMADVGLLFVAPISPIRILLYGLFSSIGKALLASLFIFYQIPNLINSLGYGFKEVLALIVIYAIMVIFNQLLSIGVYIFSNGNQNRKNLVKLILYGLIGIVAVAALLIYQREQAGILDTFYRLIESKWFGYLPVAGWSTMFFKGVIAGSAANVIISLGLFVAASLICILLLAGGKADYYEDILYSTEVNYQKLADAKEGRTSTAYTNRKIKIKDKDHGLNKGKGAYVFVYKHLVEIKRTSRFMFIDGYTIFAAISVGLAGYFIKNEADSYVILSVLVYIQYFMTVFGRLKQEMMKPYIYMVPEPSYKKVFAASVSSLLKPCADGICFFGVLAIVGGAGILQCIFMALAYMASGAVFVGLTIVHQRIFGGQPNIIAKIFIGILLFAVAIVPGVIASAMVTKYLLPDNLKFMATLPYTIVCLIEAFLMFFACRNLIDKAEYSEKFI